MAAQEGTNYNTDYTLYKKLQHKVHQRKVHEFETVLLAIAEDL